MQEEHNLHKSIVSLFLLKKTEQKIEKIQRMLTHLKFGWSLGFFRLEILRSKYQYVVVRWEDESYVLREITRKHSKQNRSAVNKILFNYQFN